MREILFRGQTSDGKWKFGSLHTEYGEMTKDGNCTIDYRILGMRGECDYVIPETVGEYTGLTDKNGKFIFEGDIVETSDFNSEDGYGEIIWDEQTARFAICGSTNNLFADFDNYFGNEIEVIGNIHDNPELM